MSDYVNLRCDTCRVEFDDGHGGAPGCWNHGRETVLELIEDAPKLLALWRDTGRRYEIHAWWGPVPLRWLEQHEGCALRPISEYEPRDRG